MAIFTLPEEGKSKNMKLAFSFYEFCVEHPELRFWQSLRAWSGVPYVLTSNYFESNMFDNSRMKDLNIEIADTFYWEGKNK